MGAGSSDAAEIKGSGWRQGSCLDEALARKLTTRQELPDKGRAGIWIVLSHDCDVTNVSLSSEPTVELIFAATIDEADRNGQIEWGKSPRQLQIVSRSQGGSSRYEISVHDREVIQRSRLLGNSPSQDRLDPDVIEQLVAWVAKRYVRSAFADAFNDRIRAAESSLRKTLKRDGGLVTGIYFGVEGHELPEGQDYRVAIRVTMAPDEFDDSTQRKRAQDLRVKIANAIDECDGIEVIGSDLVSESRFTLTDLRHTRRWDLDTLTLREEGQGEVPPLG